MVIIFIMFNMFTMFTMVKFKFNFINHVEYNQIVLGGHMIFGGDCTVPGPPSIAPLTHPGLPTNTLPPGPPF